MPLIDDFKSKMVGHVLIRDAETREVFVDKMNAIHYENMSMALASALSNRASGFIQNMVFGNGAATASGTGAVTYFPPNTQGADATLYNQTYTKVVNDMSPLNGAPTTNYIRAQHTAGNTFTDVVITCFLDYNEPEGQEAFDDISNMNGAFVFNELGLMSFDPVSNGLLLTHVIFHPVQKALNRTIEIIYTVRIYLA
jgi:hypothetical protein